MVRAGKAVNDADIVARKFFYVFTCEYCFSHYVAAVAVALTGFRLLVVGWPGLLIAWLALVWVANVYMSLFVRLRLDIKRERVELNVEEQKAADINPESRSEKYCSRCIGHVPRDRICSVTDVIIALLPQT